MKFENTKLLATNVSKIKITISYLRIKKNYVWKAHYEQLLNVEFDWDDSSLSIEPSIEGLAIKITKDMVAESVMKMKEGKAFSPSGIVIEMVNGVGDAMLDVITDLIDLIIV